MSDPRVLIEQEIPHLRRYALFLLRDSDAADDLVQETLARSLSRLHLWTPGTNLRAWLLTIQHNLFISRARRGQREEITHDGVMPEKVALAAQDDHIALRDLEEALWKLPEDQRQVILLISLEGLSYDEVATVLSVPVGTVRSRLSRGRNSLRLMMGVEKHDTEARGAP